MFAIADEVLDPCRSVGHEATVLAVLAGGLCNGPGDGAVLRQAVPAATTSAVFLLEGLDTDLTPAATMPAELLDAGSDTVTVRRLA